MLRIATWNMSHWTRTHEDRNAAWDYLRNLRVDYALLQETVVPDSFSADYRVDRPGGIGGSRPWGSAVVSFRGRISPVREARSKYAKSAVELSETYPGSVAVAANDEGLTFVSIYAMMPNGYAITTLHKQLSDLTELFDSKQGQSLIIAGDLNISTQFEEPHRSRHRNLLQRFETLGLINALDLNLPPRNALAGCTCSDNPCLHVQTQRHSRSRIPWQNDYIFLSQGLKPKVQSCYAIQEGEPDPWSFSDHCPVILELSLSAAG